MSAPKRLRNKRFKGVNYMALLHPKQMPYIIDTKYTMILASGPNGKQAWPWLQENIAREDLSIIAVNFAVTFYKEFDIPYLKPDAWVVTDRRAVKQLVPPDKKPWFPDMLKIAIEEDIKCLFTLRVIERCWNELKNPGPYFIFPCKRLMIYPDIKTNVDIIRPGGSVTCSALQIWDKIVDHPSPICLICGADMSGDKYVRGKNVLKQHGKVWNSNRVLGGMIQFLQTHRNREIYVISESKLVEHGFAEYYSMGDIINALA